MSDNGAIRITLRWIQIKDNKEAMWDDEGEFRFRSKVTTAGETSELEFPEQGYWSISDHPRRNKVDKIDKVLYEGEVGDSLVVELSGVELDQLSANDMLEVYRRAVADLNPTADFIIQPKAVPISQRKSCQSPIS